MKTKQENKLHKAFVVAIAAYILAKYVARGVEQELRTIKRPEYVNNSIGSVMFENQRS